MSPHLTSLRESESLPQALVDETRDGAVVLAGDGRVVDLNGRALEIVGLPRHAVVGSAALDFVGPASRPLAAHTLEAVRDGETVLQSTRLRVTVGRRPDVEVSARPIGDGRVLVILTECVDETCDVGAHAAISQRCAAEALAEERQARIRELLRLLLRAQERERERISRELHDEIGQSMTVIQLNHADLLETVDDVVARDRILDAMQIVDRVANQLRSLSFELRPTIIEELGLRIALESLACRLGERASLHIQADLSDVDVSPPVALACFRIAQEAMTNVIRHAKASKVHIRLFADGETLGLQVADDGVGIETPRNGTLHLGLEIMRERAACLGGEVRIQSRPGAGTTIDVRLPARWGS